MCDSITNGDPISIATTGGGGGGGGECCAPANVIIASNVLNTTGNVIAGNVIAGDGTFTGDLVVYGNIIGNLSFQTLNAVSINTGSIVSGAYYGNAAGLSNLNASNIRGSANLTNLYVQNSVTTTNLFFQNSILSTNLPVFNTAQGTWGSSSNVSRVTVDQYGRVSGASNVAITSSQWTSIDANIAYANGVSIGILSNPPTGSNLYVVGTTNVTSINVTDTLTVNGAFTSNATNTSFLFDTLTIPYINSLNIQAQGTSNMNVIFANAYYGNGAGLSNLNASNLAFGVINSALVYGNTLSNIQVSNIAGFVTGNALSNLNASNLAFGVVNSALIYGNTLSNIQVSNIAGFVTGNALSNLNASNIAFGVIDSALIYGNTLSNLNFSNITGFLSNTLSNLNASNIAFGVIDSARIYGNTLSNLTFSNVTGFLSNTLSNLNASNIAFGVIDSSRIYGNTLSNLNFSNITGFLSNTLSNLNASNIAFGVIDSARIYGNTLSNINSSNIVQPFANLVVSNSITVSNLTVTSNIIPTTGGNTYVQGNVVVSGNVYTSLGQLGAGGSLFFSLGAPDTPSYFVGSIPGAGVQTNKIRMDAFTQQGTSTYIRTSANGCFQFTQTGVYKVNAIFLTNYNNILGIGIGSNVIDYGTRTDQTYLYSLIPFVSQNPTAVLEAQFYVASTSLYYYIDAFSVDGIELQPTSNVNGGTWISIAPLGGVAAGSQTITLSTLGNTVKGQATNYGAQITDYYIGCSAGITVTLPNGATLTAGKQYVIKDESGNAAVNHITIVPYTGNLIDGQTSLVFVINYGSVTLYWTGSAWSIV